jgi:hypothetical protein
MSTHGLVTRYGQDYHAWEGIDGNTWYEMPRDKFPHKAGIAVASTYREVESDSMMVAIADEIALIVAPNEPRSPEESDQYWVHSVLWTSDLPGMDWPNALV